MAEGPAVLGSRWCSNDKSERFVMGTSEERVEEEGGASEGGGSEDAAD
jgi:hypothetical protein